MKVEAVDERESVLLVIVNRRIRGSTAHSSLARFARSYNTGLWKKTNICNEGHVLGLLKKTRTRRRDCEVYWFFIAEEMFWGFWKKGGKARGIINTSTGSCWFSAQKSGKPDRRLGHQILLRRRRRLNLERERRRRWRRPPASSSAGVREIWLHSTELVPKIG